MRCSAACHAHAGSAIVVSCDTAGGIGSVIVLPHGVLQRVILMRAVPLLCHAALHRVLDLS